MKRFKSKSYDSIYGDALEALIGACYLEKGFDFCEKNVIKNIILPYFDLEKLKWYNHKHIQGARNEFLVDELQALNITAQKTDKKRLTEATGMAVSYTHLTLPTNYSV